MMNSPFVQEAALGFARQLLEIEDADAADRIDTAFVRAYGRPADDFEIADSLAFLDEMRSCASDTGCARGSGRTLGAPASSPASASADAELYAWTRLSHVILAASEFIYIN